MMDTDQLYQKKILALAREARDCTQLDEPQFSAVADNPSCGDRVLIDINLDAQGQIQDIGARTQGCVLCEAASGFLLNLAPGRHRDEFAKFHHHISGWLNGDRNDLISDQQAAFIPVRNFPSRHTCISLPFAAAVNALKDTSSETSR
jgi:nitrogen fixation NifU-like protein